MYTDKQKKSKKNKDKEEIYTSRGVRGSSSQEAAQEN